MNDIAQGPDANPGHDFDAGHPGGRLAAYQARTEVPLDLLALVMLWFVLVPPWHYGQDVRGVWWALRIALSVVYGIDLAIRSVLSKRPGRYVRANPLALTAVLFPPVRAIFSLRLVRAMFRRGHLPRFLLAAAVLVFDGAIIVYLYERHAPHSSIHTLGESLWFSVVTVTTVGYGDYTPVTVYGRITAVFIMLVGLLTLLSALVLGLLIWTAYGVYGGQTVAVQTLAAKIHFGASLPPSRALPSRKNPA